MYILTQTYWYKDMHIIRITTILQTVDPSQAYITKTLLIQYHNSLLADKYDAIECSSVL